MRYEYPRKWLLLGVLSMLVGMFFWRSRTSGTEEGGVTALEQDSSKKTITYDDSDGVRRQGLGRDTSSSPEPEASEAEEVSSYSQAKLCLDTCGTPCSNITGEAVCPEECDEDNDCESNELCVVGSTQADGDRKWRCQKSHCAADDDCPSDKACVREVRPEGEVWLCRKSGVREIGDPCAHDEFASIGLCERGLQCINGICTLSECDVDASDSTCGPGSVCAPTGLGVGMCGPECDSEEDCRSGETCSTHRTHLKRRCLRPHAFGCLLSGCPDPEAECILNSDGLTLKTTSCMRRCQGTADCREEEVCGVQGDDVNKFCYLECGGELGGCSEGWYCPIDIIKSEGEFVRTCVRDVLGSELEFFENISKEGEEAE